MIEKDVDRIDALAAELQEVRLFATQSFWLNVDAIYDLTLVNRTISCIICGYSAPYPAFEKRADACIFNGGRLERCVCPACDCIFGPQKYLDLDDEMVGRDYAMLYRYYAEGVDPEPEIRAFHSLSPERAGLYVNWGCGAWSGSVTTLRMEGWDVWGYEPHAQYASPFIVSSQAVIRPGLDGIFSNNVIEHFRRPVQQMANLASLLKPGGTMAHATPCYEYRYSHTRFHTVFLLGRSVEVLASRAGLELIELTADGQFGNAVFRRPLASG